MYDFSANFRAHPPVFACVCPYSGTWSVTSFRNDCTIAMHRKAHKHIGSLLFAMLHTLTHNDTHKEPLQRRQQPNLLRQRRQRVVLHV